MDSRCRGNDMSCSFRDCFASLAMTRSYFWCPNYGCCKSKRLKKSKYYQKENVAYCRRGIIILQQFQGVMERVKTHYKSAYLCHFISYLWIASKIAFGLWSAILKSTWAGPSGTQRPCSQFCNVLTLI